MLEQMHSNKGLRWVQTDKIPYRDAQGDIIGVIGFSEDITERKKAEEELQKILNQLSLVNEKLGVVGSLTRHDVKE